MLSNTALFVTKSIISIDKYGFIVNLRRIWLELFPTITQYFGLYQRIKGWQSFLWFFIPLRPMSCTSSVNEQDAIFTCPFRLASTSYKDYATTLLPCKSCQSVDRLGIWNHLAAIHSYINYLVCINLRILATSALLTSCK